MPCLDYKYKPITEPHLYFYDKKTLNLLIDNNKFLTLDTQYFGRKISDLIKKPINNNFYYKFLMLFIKLKISFLLTINKNSYYFLKDSDEILMAKLYDMNKAQNEPSWWIRLIAKKN